MITSIKANNSFQLITYKSNCSSKRGNSVLLMVSVFLTSLPNKSSGSNLKVTYGSDNPKTFPKVVLFKKAKLKTKKGVVLSLEPRIKLKKKRWTFSEDSIQMSYIYINREPNDVD